MCGDDSIPVELIRKLVSEQQMVELFQVIRCYPSLGIHEHCKHVGPEPTFKDMGNVQ